MMLTSHAEEDAVFNSIVAGASGFLLKQVPGRDVVRAVETVATGQSLLDPAITLKVMEKVKKLATGQGAGEISQLSAQEQKVLALVAEGKTNREIARALGLSDKTVRNYLSHVFEKLHLSRRAEAAAFFARQRIKSS
jgi:DNA-binding NarL/FixJ family response regulator